MMTSDDFVQIFMMTTLGESILVETLRSAAYYITRSNGLFKPSHYRDKSFLKEAGNCYFFIQSTGLDVLIKYYHLDYNADDVRSTFNYCVRHAS